MTGLSWIPTGSLTQQIDQGGPYHFLEEPVFMTSPSPAFQRCSSYPEFLLGPSLILSF